MWKPRLDGKRKVHVSIYASPCHNTIECAQDVPMETPDKKVHNSRLDQKSHPIPELKTKISPTTPAPASKKGRFEDALTPADLRPDKACPGILPLSFF